ELNNSDVLIADLTETNPNVMYEVGIRQAIMEPYILMAAKGQTLPFDLSDFRTIFYMLDLDGVGISKNDLKKQLEKARSEERRVGKECKSQRLTNHKRKKRESMDT